MEYTKPSFTEIRIDRDISLVMMSDPPIDPENSSNNGNDNNKDDAFSSPFD